MKAVNGSAECGFVVRTDEDLKDEFDDSREVVQSLVTEYQACESPNYIEVAHPFAACCLADLIGPL